MNAPRKSQASKGDPSRSRMDRILFYTVGVLGFALLFGMAWAERARPVDGSPELMLADLTAEGGQGSVAMELSLLGLNGPETAAAPPEAPMQEAPALAAVPALQEAPAPQETPAPQAAPAPSDVSFSVEVLVPGSSRRFRILRLAEAPPDVQHFPLAGPPRVVLDIAQAASQPAQPENFRQIRIEHEELKAWLRNVRIGGKGRQTRMVLDLAVPAGYEVSREPGKLLLKLGLPPKG